MAKIEDGFNTVSENLKKGFSSVMALSTLTVTDREVSTIIKGIQKWLKKR